MLPQLAGRVVPLLNKGGGQGICTVFLLQEVSRAAFLIATDGENRGYPVFLPQAACMGTTLSFTTCGGHVAILSFYYRWWAVCLLCLVTIVLWQKSLKKFFNTMSPFSYCFYHMERAYAVCQTRSIL